MITQGMPKSPIFKLLIDNTGCNDLLCLGLTRSGQPKHPLYLSYETPLVPFSPMEAVTPGGKQPPGIGER